MRKKIVAGNWKMNLSFDEAVALHADVKAIVAQNAIDCEVYQFVPSIYLNELSKEKSAVQIGAQNGHPEQNGAFTGEVSIHQLSGMGIESILVGHSERRQLFNEQSPFLKDKINAALQEGMTVFFCCGETLEERESGKQETVILQQLQDALFHLSEKEFQSIVIAYEPIWAIGTGKTASPEQANSMHAAIRKAVGKQYSEQVGKNTSIIYGGSCKPTNAKELFRQPDIDGGLIGGASLQANDFFDTISSF